MKRTALVTGSSRGIGRAIALELAAAGHRVVVTCLKETSRAEEVAEQIRAGGGEALAIAAEDADFVRQAAAWLATRPNAEQLHDRVWVAVIECRSGPQHFGEGDPDTSRSSSEGEKGG